MSDRLSLTPALRAELDALEAEIDRLRLLRSDTTYRLERALRERDRLARHLGLTSATREDNRLDDIAE